MATLAGETPAVPVKRPLISRGLITQRESLQRAFRGNYQDDRIARRTDIECANTHWRTFMQANICGKASRLIVNDGSHCSIGSDRTACLNRNPSAEAEPCHLDHWLALSIADKLDLPHLKLTKAGVHCRGRAAQWRNERATDPT